MVSVGQNQFLQDNADSNTPYIYNNNSVFYITGNINNFEDDDDDIEEVFDTLMDNDNLDFSDRTKYDKVLLDNINTNFDFINLFLLESDNVDFSKESLPNLNGILTILFFVLTFFPLISYTFEINILIAFDPISIVAILLYLILFFKIFFIIII